MSPDPELSLQKGAYTTEGSVLWNKIPSEKTAYFKCF